MTTMASAAIIYLAVIIAIYLFIYKQDKLYNGLNLMFTSLAMIALGLSTETILGANATTNITGYVIIAIGGLIFLTTVINNSDKILKGK